MEAAYCAEALLTGCVCAAAALEVARSWQPGVTPMRCAAMRRHLRDQQVSMISRS